MNNTLLKNIANIILCVLACILFYRFGYVIFRILFAAYIVYNIYKTIVSNNKKPYIINLVAIFVINLMLNFLPLWLIVLFLAAYILKNRN